MSILQVSLKKKQRVYEKLWRRFIVFSLFLIQFVYYQFQADLHDFYLSFLPVHQLITGIINDTDNLVNLLHIFVHALFSISIIYFLYKDHSATILVFSLSVIAMAFYIILNLSTKISGIFFFDIISVKIYIFLASPFITIFSVPMMLLKFKNI